MKQNNMNRCKKVLSWLLIACLCIGVIPTYVLNTKAAEETENTAFAELDSSDMQYQMNKLVNEGYRVVTPLTFGLKDTAGASDSGTGEVISMDKLLFSINATATGAGNFFCIYGPDTATRAFKLYINSSGNIQFYNNVDYSADSEGNHSKMYFGDTVGATSKSYNNSNSYFTIECKNTDVASFLNSEFQLWITTEFVNMSSDDDEDTDDMQIGLWINGTLYRNTYYYVPDCADNIYSGYFRNANANLTISSPIMELDHMGMVGGEYASKTGEPHTSDLVANKDMDGTTFQTSVRFEGAGGTLYYGAESVDNAVKLTSTAEGIQVSYGDEPLGWITNENVGIDVLNNNFDLKLTTKISGSDVNLDVGVENKQASFTLAGAAETLQACVGVKTEGNATVLVGDFADEDPEQITHDLDDGSYTITKSETMERLSVNGVSQDGDIALTVPGTYSIAVTENGKVSMIDVTIPEKFAEYDSTGMESKMQEMIDKGYRVVTPLTFGVPDTSYAVVKTENREDISLDKLLFSANVTFNPTGNGNSTSGNEVFYYLQGADGDNIFQMRFESGGTIIRLWNYFDTNGVSSMYFQNPIRTINPISYNKYHDMAASRFNLTSFVGTEHQIWITTEFVDMDFNDDEDTEADDLKIAIYVDGVLYGTGNNNAYGATYFYVPNCRGNTYQGRVSTDYSRIKLASPVMELNHMGMVGGEYASKTVEFTTSDLVASKVMDETTFQTSVRFEGEGGTLYYGSNDEEQAIKLTSTENGIQVKHGDKDLVLMNNQNVDIDVLNNTFDLKLTTRDVGNGKVELDICVNDRHKTFELDCTTADLTAYVGVKTEGNATVLVGEFGNDEPERVYWCLDNGAYTKTTTSSITRLSVNGSVPEVFELTKPGSYSVAVTKNGKIYMEDVITYISYDINGNEEVEIADLVRMLKVENKTTHDETIAKLSEVEKKAIGYENAETWAATPEYGKLVLGFMREALIGGIPTVTREKEVTAIDENQLTQFIESNGAYTSDFTVTVSSLEILSDWWILSCDAKYISINGKQPTIQYQMIDAEGNALYTSPVYEVGGQNEYVTREWRVTPTKEHYNTVQISFVIPEGVALFINDISNKENTAGSPEANNGIHYSSHTGLSGYAAGNTEEAFRLAGEVGYDSLITIIKFTKDSIPVCFHDDDTIRNTLRYKEGNKWGYPAGSAIESSHEANQPIEYFTYEELITNFSAGWHKDEIYKDAVVPTLEEYLQICQEYNMAPVFSVHPSYTAEEWTTVRTLLAKYDLLDKCYIKAGDLNALQVIKSVLDYDIAGYIVIQSKGSNNNVYNVAKKAGLTDKYGEVYFEKVAAEFFGSETDVEGWVEKALASGFTQITVNETGLKPGFSGERMRQLIELGVTHFNLDYHTSIGLNW